MDLADRLENVTDRASFLSFVKALIADREDEVAKEKLNPSHPFGSGANGWENDTIESYLESAVSWAEDSHPQTVWFPEEASWKSFALFLYCGKIYE